MSDEKDLKELIERHQSYCYCAGFSCSGCEENVEKLIRIGYNLAKEENARLRDFLREASILLNSESYLRNISYEWQNKVDEVLE